MLQVIKVIWIVAVLINLSAVIWFIFGSTANFQRGIDLISTFYLVYFVIPSIILSSISIALLLKGWSPANLWGTLGVLIIIICMLSISPALFNNVRTSGWLTEHITTDSLQTTVDGKYEYKFELINSFQRNSYARLYLRDVSTGEESRIFLDIPVKKINVLNVKKSSRWITLESTVEADIYRLYTTTEFAIPNEKFELDVRKGEAKRVD